MFRHPTALACVASSFLTLLVPACGGVPAAESRQVTEAASGCIAGSSRACTCADNGVTVDGLQLCDEKGSFLACLCLDGPSSFDAGTMDGPAVQDGGPRADADLPSDALARDAGQEGNADAGAESGSMPDGSSVEAGCDGGDACAPYTHSIVIDGVNDFVAASEKFTTTSGSYAAFVTWDASNLYLGYSGSDITAGQTTGKNLLFFYLDVDPGAASGALVGQQYGTQSPQFPTAFAADALVVWNPGTNTLEVLKYTGAWSMVGAGAIALARGGDYVELRVPFSAVGMVPGAAFGLISLLENTDLGSEWTYAGLWSGSFTDGYYVNAPLKYSLLANLSAAGAPNSAADRTP